MNQEWYVLELIRTPIDTIEILKHPVLAFEGSAAVWVDDRGVMCRMTCESVEMDASVQPLHSHEVAPKIDCDQRVWGLVPLEKLNETVARLKRKLAEQEEEE